MNRMKSLQLEQLYDHIFWSSMWYFTPCPGVRGRCCGAATVFYLYRILYVHRALCLLVCLPAFQLRRLLLCLLDLTIFNSGSVFWSQHRVSFSLHVLGMDPLILERVYGHPPRPEVMYLHHRIISSRGKKRYTCICLLNGMTNLNMGHHLPCKRRCDDSSCRR